MGASFFKIWVSVCIGQWFLHSHACLLVRQPMYGIGICSIVNMKKKVSKSNLLLNFFRVKYYWNYKDLCASGAEVLWAFQIGGPQIEQILNNPSDFIEYVFVYHLTSFRCYMHMSHLYKLSNMIRCSFCLIYLVNNIFVIYFPFQYLTLFVDWVIFKRLYVRST